MNVPLSIQSYVMILTSKVCSHSALCFFAIVSSPIKASCPTTSHHIGTNISLNIFFICLVELTNTATTKQRAGTRCSKADLSLCKETTTRAYPVSLHAIHTSIFNRWTHQRSREGWCLLLGSHRSLLFGGYLSAPRQIWQTKLLHDLSDAEGL